MKRHAVGFKKIKGRVESESVACLGVCALIGLAGDEYGLFAPTTDELMRLWERVSPGKPLDKTRIQQIAIFSENAVTGGSRG